MQLDKNTIYMIMVKEGYSRRMRKVWFNRLEGTPHWDIMHSGYYNFTRTGLIRDISFNKMFHRMHTGKTVVLVKGPEVTKLIDQANKENSETIS